MIVGNVPYRNFRKLEERPREVMCERLGEVPFELFNIYEV